MNPGLRSAATPAANSVVAPAAAPADPAEAHVPSSGLPASLPTIGRLVSGFGDQSTGQFQEPVVDVPEMARGMRVTFRPLPKRLDPALRSFTERLQACLREAGVEVLPWEEATFQHSYDVSLPLTRKRIKVGARLTKGDVHAVFDVRSHVSWATRIVRPLLELSYRLHRRFTKLQGRHRLREIFRLTAWAEDHTIKYVSDHVRTQMVAIRPLDRYLADPEVAYRDKLVRGMRRLSEALAPIVIGAADDQIALLNLNMSDTVYPADKVKQFVNGSLIPKLHAPILPVTKGRFQIETYSPGESPFVQRVVELGQRIAELGLLPDAISLQKLVRRQSTRDIVDELVNGRSGMSFGFVAWVEPPVYEGPREVTAEEWERMAPLKELPADEVRRSEAGRWYLRTTVRGETVYRQIPDVWIVSSRSGAEKKDLRADRDVLKLGFDGSLQLRVPDGVDWDQTDIRPSFDTYVMIALALGTAIYQPEMVEDGAPMVHFHGYPAAEWFRDGEAWTGAENPSLPCGTFESGVLNFAGTWRLAERRDDLRLACLVEPDHGSNFVARDVETLLGRLREGVDSGEIVLGGRHAKSLRHDAADG